MCELNFELVHRKRTFPGCWWLYISVAYIKFAKKKKKSQAMLSLNQHFQK